MELPTDVVEAGGRLDWRLLLTLRKLIRQHRVQLVQAHLSGSSVYASIVGAWTGVPVVSTFHGRPDFDSLGWTRSLRFGLLSRYSAPVCVSETLREELSAASGIPEEEIEVIPNGVDLPAFRGADGRAVRRERGVPDDAVLVGALGNIRPAKDFSTFLRAAAVLAPDRRFTFAVAGDPCEPLYSELRRLRAELGLDHRVAFWGFMPDPAAVVSAFDVLVISSSSEGFSLAAVQAMAAGTPVVSTRCGGPETILTHQRDGLLVPVGSPPELASAVRSVADDEGLRRELVREGIRTVERRYSLDAMLEAYDVLYRRLALRPDRVTPLRSS